MSRVRPRWGSRGRLATGLTAVVCSILPLSSCSRDHPPGPARAGEEPTQITRGFTTTESDSGEVRFIFKAQIARQYANDVTRAEAIQVDFYDRGQKVSVLTAKQGYLDAGGRMTAQGNCKVVSHEGYLLETEKLYWDRDKRKIRSDEFVKVSKGREVLTGYGLTTGPNLDLVTIERDVQAEVTGQGQAESR